MATFDVSNVNDLIAAIKSANANGEDDVINLAAGTYDLNTYSGHRGSDNDFLTLGTLVNGLPLIKTNIALVGEGAFTTTIARYGGNPYRLIHVTAAGHLTLQKVTLTNGDVGTWDVGGGAIEVFGDAVIEDCCLGPDNKSNYGGALVNAGSGTVIIRRCDIFGNQADWGGGIYNYTNAKTNLYDTRVADNKAITNLGGLYYAGGIYNANLTYDDRPLLHCRQPRTARWRRDEQSQRRPNHHYQIYYLE